MDLYLVRHTSVGVSPGVCYGQSDVELAVSFREEAEIVKSQLQNIGFSAVFSSPLSRCTKLASFCGFESATIDNNLMEMDFGEWEGQRWDEIVDPHLAIWYQCWTTERTTGGESFQDLCYRAETFLKKLKGDDKVLVFTHAGFIRAVGVALGIHPIREAFSQAVAYGEIIKHINITPPLSL